MLLVVFITRLKQRVLQGLRFAFVLAILAIILVQLASLLTSSGWHTRDEAPAGNPMRVEAHTNQFLKYIF